MSDLVGWRQKTFLVALFKIPRQPSKPKNSEMGTQIHVFGGGSPARFSHGVRALIVCPIFC